MNQPAARKLYTVIPVGRPGSQVYFRVRPGSAYQLDAAFLDLQETRETYIIVPECVDLFRPSEIYHASLFWVLTQNKSLMLWPVKLSRDGREKTWNTSVREAALAATTTWVRVVANHEINIYEPIAAEKDLGEPEWPHLTPTEALRIAFRNKCIDREDHAVIKRLRGLS